MRACVRAVALVSACGRTRACGIWGANRCEASVKLCVRSACVLGFLGRSHPHRCDRTFEKKSIKSCHFGGILGDFWDQTTAQCHIFCNLSPSRVLSRNSGCFEILTSCGILPYIQIFPKIPGFGVIQA